VNDDTNNQQPEPTDDEQIPEVFRSDIDPSLFLLGTGTSAVIAWFLAAILLENILIQAPTGQIETSELMLMMTAVLVAVTLMIVTAAIGIVIALRNHWKKMSWEIVKELRKTQH